MKNIIALFFFISFVMNINAQKLISGNLSCLKSETKVNMVCDFSKCEIEKRPASLKIEEEPEWNKGINDIIQRYNRGQSTKNKYFSVGQYPESKYTIVYKLSSIDDDKDCKGQLMIIETASNKEVALISNANGSAGTFGSFFNLLGDAFEDLDQKTGKIFRVELAK